MSGRRRPGSSELVGLDAVAQADMVRRGEVSALELVESAIGRIEAANPAVNAVVWECFEEARAAASAPLDGPFAGVPLLLKDLGCAVRGHPDHQGCEVLRRAGHRHDHDSALARRFMAAGFVIVGRTNAPEFGLVSDTRNRAYGATRNPWDLGRTPSGSSGGSAAAVAAGMTPLAHGTDGGGSLRLPASACGLVGLKPSRGRVSRAPGGDVLFGHDTEGVITTSVRDNAAVLDAIAGPVPGDPTVAPAPSGRFTDAIATPPGRLRIGFVAAAPRSRHRTDPECTAAVERAAALLEEAGHDVDEAWPAALFDERFWDTWSDALAPWVTLAVEAATAIAGPDADDVAFDPVTELWDRRGRAQSATDLTQRLLWLDDFRRRVAVWWADGFDVLLTPVAAMAPPPSGYFWSYPGGIEDSVDILQFTPQFNSTGQPVVAVPMHRTPDGLPVGVQLVGRYGAEEVLLSLAAQVEQLRPWHEASLATARGMYEASSPA